MASNSMLEKSEEAFHINGIRSASTYDSTSELDKYSGSLVSIAIVGLSIRFPDEATSLDSFWDMLIHARCASREFPPDRMNIDAFHHHNGETSGSLPLRGGHFLRQDISTFDAPFFSITPAEAEAMDPLQRRLLETAYTAFENAGIGLEAAQGSNTSVHIGCFSTDYTSNLSKDPEQMPKYTGTGGAPSMLSNRLSWFFDLRGPSLTLDTACSSSMVALDLACQALQSGQSDMGLVGGCNLIYSVEMTMALSKLGFLSRNSRCYSFDHRANGYARGEGFGVLILKRVEDAIRDRDTIRAVIRSTGSNQDGHTPGITMPSKEAQASLIRKTYQKAGLDMQMTGYFEAHGTGTPIGDPIEASAIGSAFQYKRPGKGPLYVGAVKANIGHLEGASGIAGVIKTILVLEKGVIPANANLEQVNPRIDSESLNIQFPNDNTIWSGNGLRRASINSFGFGGTNAHAVIDDAYNYLRLRNLAGNHCTVRGVIEPESLNNFSNLSSHSEANALPKLVVWSAADETVLSDLAMGYRSYFERLSLKADTEGSFLENLSYTLNTRRTSLLWKSFVVANSLTQLKKRTLSTPVQSKVKPRLAFIFTGQGAQWYAMGRELLIYPVFKCSLLKAQRYLEELDCDWLLLDQLLKDNDESDINDPRLSQPLCTALQIALVDLFRSIGISPAAVIGHSSGEIAAAYCVGALHQHAALKVAYYRGALASRLSKEGQIKQSMISVGLSEEQIPRYLEKVAPGLNVSCINSPKNITLAGDEDQVNGLKLVLEKDGIFARKLNVRVAYHSPQMNQIAVEYSMLIEELDKGDLAGSGNIGFISSVTGRSISAAGLCKADYWVENMVKPVKFKTAVETLCSRPTQAPQKKLDGSHRKFILVHDLLEIGPHSALQGPIRDILKNLTSGKDFTYSSALVRNRSALETFMEAAGSLYCLGHPVRLGSVNIFSEKHLDHHPVVLSNLPEYPFNHSQTHWYESRMSKNYRFRQHPPVSLLGTQVQDWNPFEARWRNILRVAEIPWVSDHQVNGSILFPAAGMLVMAIEAAKQLSNNHKIVGYEIKDATFQSPMNLSLNPTGLETELYLRPLRDASDKDNAWSQFRLYVCEGGQWTEICKGEIQVEYETSSTQVDGGLEANKMRQMLGQSQTKLRGNCTKIADARYVYSRLKANGLDYGPAFRPLKRLRYGDNFEAMADLTLPFDAENVIHPTTLDGMLQLTFVGLTKGGTDVIPTTVATRISRLWLASSGFRATPVAESVEAFSKTELTSYRTAESYICALSSIDQEVKIKIDGFEATAITSSENPVPAEANEAKQVFYNVDWKPDIDLLDSQQLLKYCERGRRHLEPDSEDFFLDLDFLLFSFISSTHRQLKGGVTFPVPHVQNYIQWMELQIHAFETSSLGDSNREWERLLQDSAYVEALTKRLERSNKQGKYYVKVGENLPEILSGKVDLLDLVFGDGLLQDFYGDLRCFDMLALYLDALAHKNPGMKVLEVEAGVGAISTLILKTLISHGEQESGTPRYSQYDFTDISISFFAKAQKAVEAYPRIKFSALDIESDPRTQAFELTSYDLIVAATVVHPTKDISTILQNIRMLLKPGGKLVLVEMVRPTSLRAGIAFGLFPRSYLSTDPYLSQGPCNPENTWHNVLKKTGFSGVDVEFRDFESNACHGFSILISTANPATVNCAAFSPILIIADPESERQQALAKGVKVRLEKSGQHSCSVICFQEAAITSHGLHGQCCLLLEEAERSILRETTQEAFNNLKAIILNSNSVLWVTEQQCLTSPDFGMVQGLSRVVRTEHTKLTISTLALDFHDSIDKGAENIEKVLSGMVLNRKDRGHEPEYLEKDGLLQISRLVEAKDLNQDIFLKTSPPQLRFQHFKEGPALKLSIKAPGLLDTLEFREDTAFGTPLAPGEIEVEVRAVGLNFLDCLAALGRVNAKALGSECAGLVTRIGDNCQLRPGDRVSVCSVDVFGTYARVMEDCTIKIPDTISFIVAAAVPTTFTTVYYGLCEVARMQKGETILIHAGAGGTGQAAIQLAQNAGLEIFATVGSNEKKGLLIDRYGLEPSHILYSRDLSFAQGIKRLTSGRGVDIVLNSLAGEGLVASWECIAPYGRFIEIGKKDIYSHGKLPMFPFAANVSFSAIDLAFKPQNRPPVIRRSFENAMMLLKEGKMRPAHPLNVFGLAEIEKAFRYLQSGKHSGKIVIDYDLEDKVPMILEPKPAYSFDAEATYLISGGLGGLGRSIARWMVSRGAKNLLLLSRSGPVVDKSRSLVEELRRSGARIGAPVCDVADAISLERVLRSYEKTMPPIRGCIQGSMVLRDATFETMSPEDWNASVAPKVQGSWNLHSLLPKGLQFFILLSSVCGVFGNGGQANYAAGNAYQDALARYRVAHGEKAAALDIGALLSEGVLAENDSALKRTIRTGILPPMSQAELFALLNHYCDPGFKTPSSELKCQSMTGIETPANIQAMGMETPYWIHQPLFRHLHQISPTIGTSSSSGTTLNLRHDFESSFAAVGSLSEAGTILTEALSQKLSKILGLPVERIDPSRPMGSYGVDSLVAVELRNWFAREVSAEVAIFEILGEPSISSLAVAVARRSQYRLQTWTD